MWRVARVGIGLLLLVGGLAACDAPGTAAAPPDSAANATQGPGEATTTTSGTTTTAESTTSPSTDIPFTDIDVSEEAPPFEEVSFTTADDMTLRGRLWRGSDIAVLVAHDFGNTTAGAAGQRAEQSGETVLWLSGALARQGYTVLSPDYRGHGLSDGDIDKRAGSTDMTAAYTWLLEQGAREVVVLGWVGSGTVAAHLDATDDAVDFAGIILAFSPPQEIGHDAQSVIGDLATPVFAVGINTGTTARFAKLLSNAAGNSLGYHVFDAVPNGLTFRDVFSGELAGRIVAFIETVTT